MNLPNTVATTNAPSDDVVDGDLDETTTVGTSGGGSHFYVKSDRSGRNGVAVVSDVRATPIASAAAMLDEVAAFIRRFVVLLPEQVDALALWVAHTHLLNAAETTPYLSITSAEKRSGKTRLLETLEALVARPWYTGRATPAVLARKIDAEKPTLLLDESDAAFNGDREYAETLRGVLNTGHRRGGKTSVCVGKGVTITYQDFSTFGAKAIVGIGNLPDTVADRSIQIRLTRRASNEPVARSRQSRVWADATPLREQLTELAQATEEILRGAAPDMPSELDDRAADGWEPLFAIAEMAGEGWPKRAHRAALNLSTQDVRNSDSIGVRLLADIRQVFEAEGVERLSTSELVQKLMDIPESPWIEWRGASPPRELAKQLRPFGVSSRTIRLENGTPKGYMKDDFVELWSRYLSPLPKSETSATTPQAAVYAPEDAPTGSNKGSSPGGHIRPRSLISDSPSSQCGGSSAANHTCSSRPLWATGCERAKNPRESPEGSSVPNRMWWDSPEAGPRLQLVAEALSGQTSSGCELAAGAENLSVEVNELAHVGRSE